MSTIHSNFFPEYHYSELARLVMQISKELHKKDCELILVIPAKKKGYAVNVLSI